MPFIDTSCYPDLCNFKGVMCNSGISEFSCFVGCSRFNISAYIAIATFGENRRGKQAPSYTDDVLAVQSVVLV